MAEQEVRLKNGTDKLRLRPGSNVGSADPSFVFTIKYSKKMFKKELKVTKLPLNLDKT